MIHYVPLRFMLVANLPDDLEMFLVEHSLSVSAASSSQSLHARVTPIVCAYEFITEIEYHITRSLLLPPSAIICPEEATSSQVSRLSCWKTWMQPPPPAPNL